MANIPYSEYAGTSLPAVTDLKYSVGDQFLLRIGERFKIYVLSPQRTWVFNQGITDAEQDRLTQMDNNFIRKVEEGYSKIEIDEEFRKAVSGFNGTLSPASDYVDLKEGMWLPSGSGNYSGLEVDLSEGFTLLNYDDEIITKVLYPFTVDYKSNISVVINNFKISVDKLIIGDESFVFDSFGGYRRIANTEVLLEEDKIYFLSNSATSLTDPLIRLKGSGEDIFIFGVLFYELPTVINKSIPVGMFRKKVWTPSYYSFSEKTIPINGIILDFDNLTKTIINEANTVRIDCNKDNSFLFGAFGDYRPVLQNSIEIPNEHIAVISSSPTNYSDPELYRSKYGQGVYFTVERYDKRHEFPSLGDNNKTILVLNRGGILYSNFPQITALNINAISSSKEWLPVKSKTISPFFKQLKEFYDKYVIQEQDVTLTKIGDSISTDLNWTEKLKDAKERPPFCTEYNVNSFLEEKLRWKEQRYRRHDYDDIFTEIKGGGTSQVKTTDSNWGFVGDAYYLPSTKVIDGGTNAGVAFDTVAMTQRVALIVHTDKAWANQTQITISAGNGKALVKDGAGNWVEANGHVLSLKEEDTLATLGFNKDNAQKRIDLKIILNISAPTTITIKNIGVGRFAYWGIEYSPKPYIFRYICASKGSHTIADLERYESWMVDSFNPDLVLWQCPILNEGIGQEFRSYNTATFVKRFTDKLSRLHAKNYLVFPYILWGAVYSKFIDSNGNFTYGFSTDDNKEYTAWQEAAKLNKALLDINDGLSVNLFDHITDIGLEKAKVENSNIFSAALVGSGKNGNTFTIDSIHLNKIGEELVWAMLETYFNF